jgi:Domain of unknown function (DUF397)
MTAADDPARAGGAWRKSMRSNDGGNCVEVAAGVLGQVAVRDSADPGGPVLVFTPARWTAFCETAGRQAAARPAAGT